MDPLIVGVIGICAFFLLLLFGMPLAVSSAVVGLAGIVLLRGVNAGLQSAQVLNFTAISNFNLAVIPLFVAMGMVLFSCGIGEEIFYAARQWLGHYKGGLAMATTGASAALGTCTGSSGAVAALMAKVAYPEMKKYGYQPDLALGTVAGTSTLATIIPPSILTVLYAVLAEQSAGKLLVAGFIPGLVEMVLFMLVIWLMVWRNPTLAPASPPATMHARVASLIYLVPVGIMFAIIVLGIYAGIFTATEAGGIATAVSLALVLITKRLTWSRLKEIALETGRVTVMVYTFLIGIAFLTQFLNMSGLTLAFTRWAVSFPSSALTLALMFVVYFVLGCFIGASGMVMITTPIFVPAVITAGYDPIWFGILVIKWCEIALLTPPVAVNLYIAQGVVKEVPLERATKAILPFLAMDFVSLALFMIFPGIITFLPNAMGGK